MTPDQLLQQFKEGNERFRTNTTNRDHSAQIRNSAVGQYPKAVVLSCLDSREPVEDVFDQGLGDVFVRAGGWKFCKRRYVGQYGICLQTGGGKINTGNGSPALWSN